MLVLHGVCLNVILQDRKSFVKLGRIYVGVHHVLTECM